MLQMSRSKILCFLFLTSFQIPSCLLFLTKYEKQKNLIVSLLLWVVAGAGWPTQSAELVPAPRPIGIVWSCWLLEWNKWKAFSTYLSIKEVLTLDWLIALSQKASAHASTSGAGAGRDRVGRPGAVRCGAVRAPKDAPFSAICTTWVLCRNAFIEPFSFRPRNIFTRYASAKNIINDLSPLVCLLSAITLNFEEILECMLIFLPLNPFQINKLLPIASINKLFTYKLTFRSMNQYTNDYHVINV